MNFFDELKERGLVNNVTNQQKINTFFKEKNNRLYVGFDPSAISLHLGNYVMITLLKRFQNHGFKICAVIGGATGMIGDPSGKFSERTLLDEKQVEINTIHIKNQLISLLKDVDIFNNIEIYKSMNVIDYLRDIGKAINVNHLLEKEIIKKRLETGISYTEFSYSIIQGYDFYYLYKNKNISLQIGGSDQWANIVSGIDYIRKEFGDNNTACGITINLLTKSDGSKFGKSESGALYLDKNLTSPYEMYQFLINQSDDDIVKLLRFLSLKPLEQINTLISDHQKNPSQKNAQKELAKEIISDIYGKDEFQSVLKISECIFSNRIEELTSEELKIAFKNVPHFNVNYDNTNIVELLVDNKIVASKRIARELICGKSIYVNNKLVDSDSFLVSKKDGYGNEFSLVRKGKKNYFIVIWK